MLSFMFTIVLIYIMYYIWIVIHYNKNGERKINKKRKKEQKQMQMPAEVEYFVAKYKIDLSKINFRYFLQLMGLTVAFDLSIVISIVSYIDTLWIQFLTGFILMLATVLTSFYILGKYFKKKGLTKDV